MAGYLVAFDSVDALNMCLNDGIYATLLSRPNGSWKSHHEGTFADYSTMREGDNIYFFIERNIYGIGKLKKVGPDCKYKVHPHANRPTPLPRGDSVLIQPNRNSGKEHRWFCTFEPDPYFFTKGLDIDDFLSSAPSQFKMLRAFWKLSFIKFDNDENQAFKSALLQANKATLANPAKGGAKHSNWASSHATLVRQLATEHLLDAKEIIASCSDGNCLCHERALEAGLLYQLSNPDKFPNTREVFGEWDYLSHQVISSPFKPIDYMDKMDIFGYSFIKGFPPTKSDYLVIELKKGAATRDHAEQLMKYVDWIREEYTFGNYSMIKAFLVAYGFEENLVTEIKNIALRRYTVGKRPTVSGTWQDLKLVRYSYNATTYSIDFSLV